MFAYKAIAKMGIVRFHTVSAQPAPLRTAGQRFSTHWSPVFQSE
jgi:hypothetical protein